MTGDKPDTSLEDIRREIDKIDDDLLGLLIRRFDASARVRATKKTDGSIASSPLRPGREAAMLRRLIAASDGKVPPDALVRLWRVILSASTQVQAPVTIHVGAEAAGNPALSIRITEHFSGMNRQLHPDVASCLSALLVRPGDLAVTELTAPWAEWIAAQPVHQPISVVATLPVIAGSQVPELLVFGHADPQPCGFDETIVISSDDTASGSKSLRWQARSGGWYVCGLSGFLNSGDLRNFGKGAILAGRCPTSIEVSQ